MLYIILLNRHRFRYPALFLWVLLALKELLLREQMVDNGQEFSGKSDDCNFVALLPSNSLEEFLQVFGSSLGDHVGCFDEGRSEVF